MGQYCNICFSNNGKGHRSRMVLEDLRDTNSLNRHSVNTNNSVSKSAKSIISTQTLGPSGEMNLSSFMSNYNTRANTKDQGSISALFYTSADISIDSFKILKVIGRGSFGKVFLVQKKDSLEYFAMKTLKKDVILRRNQKINTQAERIILEKIRHPFIVRLHYAFQTPEKLYFVIDFLNGGELFYHLRREQRFSEDRTRFYAAEILLALECLHKNGVIYRDLKPENVLLDSEGHVKLTDFGLSKIREKNDELTYTFCGTPEYLAPEIIKNEGYSKEVDFWALVSQIISKLFN